MRLKKYLNEENMIAKALSLPEPEDGGEYSDEVVNGYLKIINQALSDIEDASDDESDMAMRSDILDKKEKWENWKEEVKADGPTDSEPIKIAKIMAPPDPEAKEK